MFTSLLLMQSSDFGASQTLRFPYSQPRRTRLQQFPDPKSNQKGGNALTHSNTPPSTEGTHLQPCKAERHLSKALQTTCTYMDAMEAYKNSTQAGGKLKTGIYFSSSKQNNLTGDKMYS